MRKLALVLICTLLSACLDSINPASDPAKAAVDPALLGAWRGTFDDDVVYLHVGWSDALSRMQAVTVEHRKKDGALDVSEYTAFPSHLGKLDVLNVMQTSGKDRSDGYTLLKYRASGGKLTLWSMSEEALRADVKAGKVKGTVGSDTFGDVTITASTAEIAAYLQAADPARLFTNVLKFDRAGKT